jgi:hypothetical protein
MQRSGTAAKMRGHTDNRPPILFRCLLDEQPTELLTGPALAKLKRLRAADDLVLNPCCQFSSNDLRQLPFLERFFSVSNALWTLDPATDALLPFWLSADSLRRLESTQPGDPPPRDIPSHLASALRFADLLVSRDFKKRRRKEWAGAVAELAAPFQERGYVPLTGLLHPFHVASLRRYFRELIAAGAFETGKDRYANCDLEHNEPVARFFHHQLASVISDLSGEPVRPSFVFICSYRGGAELHRHTDREQCEFTISLCIDFIPEPRGVTRWPLYLETKKGRVVIQQALGDGLLFRGRELPHYRKPLPNGYTSTSLLFHFVRRDFTGPLD